MLRFLRALRYTVINACSKVENEKIEGTFRDLPQDRNNKQKQRKELQIEKMTNETKCLDQRKVAICQ